MSIYESIVKIGGSLLFNNKKQVDSQKIINICEIIKKNNKNKSVVLVVGGGIIARDYINFVRKTTGNEALCDLFGINISRINANLFISYLGDLAYPVVPKTYDDLALAQHAQKIIVLGGIQPAQSTTSVSLEVAEFLESKRIVILTDVEGIYSKDPRVYSDAELQEELTYSQLEEIILKGTTSTQAAAGEYRVFDAVSLQIMKRSNLQVFIGSGVNLSKFEQFWKGTRRNIGTKISR